MCIDPVQYNNTEITTAVTTIITTILIGFAKYKTDHISNSDLLAVSVGFNHDTVLSECQLSSLVCYELRRWLQRPKSEAQILSHWGQLCR